MAFWKKSEDPWDADPARAREKREREPVENPLDALRDWNEERRAKAAAKRAEWEAQPKEICPWCGREMERGCLQGGRGIYWYTGKPSASAFWWSPRIFEESIQVDDEGDLLKGTYKTAWYCRECGKVVFSLPPKAGESDSWHRELEGYARDARGDVGEREEDPS